tara:strand:+ start:58612 stop:59262 length:651 start_codon:yes stop_codon:yes gene_type:complete
MQKLNHHHWQSDRFSLRRRTPARVLRADIQSQAGRHAFTLIEMLIVIMLISILASVSLISTDTSGSLSLDTSARMLVADLRLARNYAIKFNTQYTVRFDSNAQSYEILHTGAGNLPVPQDLLAGSGTDSDKYIKNLQIQSMNLPNQIFIRQIQLKTSQTKVRELEFGPMGGTGPARNEDTIIMLSTTKNGTAFYIPITVSWITGQAWVEDIQTLTN